MTRRLLFLPLLLMLASHGLVQSGELQDQLPSVVEPIGRYLREKGEARIMLGEFKALRGVAANYGPGLRDVLRIEFAQRKIPVEKGARFELVGHYGLASNANNQPQVAFLRFVFALVDTRTGMPVESLNLPLVNVTNPAHVAEVLGVTVSLDPIAPDKDRERQTEEAVRKPTTVVDGTKVRARPGSPFSVELLCKCQHDAKGDGKALPIHLIDGNAYVDARKGMYPSVRITNSASYDASIRFSWDGLDLFAFADDTDPKSGKILRDPRTRQPRYSHVTIPRGKSVVLRGWFRNLNQVDAFSVTDYAWSAAAELQSTAPVGVLVVTFAASWENEADRPKDEAGTKSPVGIGRGPLMDQTSVEVRRKIGPVRDTVTIRYSKETPNANLTP